MRLLLPAGLLLALLALFSTTSRADIVEQLDKPAQDVTCVRWWNEAPPKMAKLQGKVVLVHLSNPTKLLSRAFVKNIRRLHETYAARGLVVIEVLLVDDEAEAATYVEKEQVPWHVGADTEHTARANYMGTSEPRSYLIAPDGQIVFHAHVGALSTSVVEGQLDRLPFFDPKSVPAKAKALAKAAAEQKYATVMKEIGVIERDKYADDETKRLAEVAKKDMERDHAFQKKLLEEEIRVRDWGVAWERVERMLERFKNTPHEDAFLQQKHEMEKSERAVWVRERQKELDSILAKAKTKRKKDVEKLIRRLTDFAEFVGEARPGYKAREWIKLLEERLSKMR